MKLAEIVYDVYLRTVDKNEFVEELSKNSIYSNCEVDVLETMWELIELMIY